jgi:hypothetical protein
MQILILPVGDKTWKENLDNEVKKILGKEVSTKETNIDKILSVPASLASKAGDFAFGASEKEEKPKDKITMFDLSPGAVDSLKDIERKGNKVGFKTKIRYIYLGTKDSGFNGALKQFALLNGNGFRPAPGTTTKSDSPFKKIEEKRVYKIQKRILKNYKSRSQSAGTEGVGFILNTEELASIYHFPYIGTTTATVRTAESKKSVAPMGLPEELEGNIEPVESPKPEPINKQSGPPENLPM